MRQYSIGSRYIALLLLVAMIFSMVPAMQFGVSAAVGDETKFKTKEEDGVEFLNNGNEISLPIKINNFALDGLLFDYLSSTRSANNADDYYWEYSKNNGKAFVQLYPYYLGGKSIGNSDLNIVSTTGISGPIKLDGSLDTSSTTTGDYYGTRSDGITAVRALIPETGVDGGGNNFVRLYPRMWKDTYQSVPGIQDGDNPNGTGKGRAWIKLTTFVDTQNVKVDDIRYAVIVYRLPNGNKVENGKHSYSNFGLTINSFDEASGNCSVYAGIDPEGGNEWQYAIIDLLGRTDSYKIASGTRVTSLYLQAPLAWSENGRNQYSYGYTSGPYYMDIAAVGYFPYYGDAEQFGNFGLTMGCQQKYFNANNAGFSFRNNSNTHYSLTGSTRTQVNVHSMPTFWQNEGDGTSYKGARPINIDTYATSNTFVQDLKAKADLLDEIGNNLYGSVKGQATFGLVETALGEDGRPVYKESVVSYLARYLRHQLLSVPEYPHDNYGWRNYSFITGVSTTDGTNQALFGKSTDGTNRSIDLATALCNAIGVKKGSAVKSGTTGSFGTTSGANYDYSLSGKSGGGLGSYKDTLAHKDELIGTWKDCKDNIHSWYDAAYYLLNNLYVTETDVADTKVDGYGDYEDTYQYLVLPQIEYTAGGSTTTPYFFDSGYAKYEDINDVSTYSSALTYNENDHTISLNTDAQGIAQFNNDGAAAGQNPSSWFPFLVTSGNNTPQGETNTTYYLHDGALSRESQGTTYHNRDFNYSLSGSGYFAYEPGLYFNFQGDDDVYVFINGQLVIDLGGTHGATSYEMALDDYVNWARRVRNGTEAYKGKYYGSGMPAEDKARVDALCLVTGGVYSFDFFYMERHGVGSNLRIMTNMKIAESSLGVDKFAFQNGIEVTDNGMVNVEEAIEYGFSITNNSDGKLYDLSFTDSVIGVTLDPDNGLQVTGRATDSIGAKLTPASLVITVDGYDASGKKLDTINVSCPNNEALINFLKTLSAEGTQDGVVEEDFYKPYEGSGLWKEATVTIRGIYYKQTEAQKKVNSFTNSVIGAGFAKVAGENGEIEEYALRGIARHTVYQPGQPAYYQWVGHPIVIESERLYNDLIAGKIVAGAGDLPKPANMILIPSNSSGTEIASEGISNVPGGDVYLKVNFAKAGSFMVYVTILDQTDPDYSMTVPLTIYALGGQDSVFVLDYGLDTYLTESDAIFDYEIDAAAGDVTGTVLGIAEEGVTPAPSYVEYDENAILNAVGQVSNKMTLVNGKYDGNGEHSDNAVYQLNDSVYLDHNKPWVLEWKVHFGSDSSTGSGSGVLLFSGMKTSNTENMYVFANPANGWIFMGEHNAEHIDIAGDGKGTNLVYNNYGAWSQTVKDSLKAMTEYKLVNVPDGMGGNTVYLYVGTTKVGPMTTYCQGGGNAAGTGGKTNQTWLSGKDFTFDFVGTTGHGLDRDYEYIRVYEDGYQLTHSKWKLSGTTMNTVSTGEIGYVNNTATYKTHTYNSNTKGSWDLNQPLTLAHDDNWSISFKLSGITTANNTIALSALDTQKANANLLYLASLGDGTQFVGLGYRVADGSSTNPSTGTRIVYAAKITADVVPNYNMSGEHTYLLENRVLPTGKNMVYLYVDDIYVGPLTTKYQNSTQQAVNSNELSGMDFTFHRIGDNKVYGFFGDAKLSELEIRSKTTLHNSYEWVPGSSGLTSTVATDNKGSQIEFTNDDDGIVDVTGGKFTLNGKRLKFEATEFMNKAYSAYVAFSVHDKSFNPTPIETDGIDIGHEAQMYKKITVLPANVVYYEDDFPAIHYYGTSVEKFEDLKNEFANSGDYSDTKYQSSGSSDDLTQSPDQDTPYGSDNAYQDIFSNVSGGSVHTIAINNDGPLVWFQFSGTGFELEARTSATQAGMIFVEVYKSGDVVLDANNKNYPKIGKDGFIECKTGKSAVDIIPVNPLFDNGNVIDGEFQHANGGAEAIYQVPVINYEADEYGEYIVVISGVENLDYDNKMAHIDSYLYLDGIRIYNPLGFNDEAIEHYGDQKNVVFEEIRNHIVDGNILVCDYTSAGVIASSALTTWTEKYDNKNYNRESTYIGNAVNDVNDYLMDGPNNEVYLDGTFTNGALVFYVRQTSAAENNILHLGVRALDAGLYYGAATTGMRANLMIGIIGNNGSNEEPGWYHVATVSSGTEQYYSIPYTLAPVVDPNNDGNLYHQVVIKVEAYSDDVPAMVSFTNIKRSEGLEIYKGDFIAAEKPDAEGNAVIDEESTGYNLLRNLSYQMSAYRSFTINEAEPGADFVVNDNNNEDENAPAIIPSYPTLSFDGEVRYNIYFDINNLDGVALEDMGLITFDSKLFDGTIADATDVIPGAFTNGVEYMVHTNGIPAKNLGDMVYFKVYAKLADGTYVYSDLQGYNAIYYAEYILENTDSDEMKSLVVATLNYGAAAQKFFGYKTDSLMNAGLTAEQQALIAPYSADMATDIVLADQGKAGQFAATGGFSNMYATVSFEGAFAINYYFTPNKAMDGNMTMYYWDAETYNRVNVLTAENALGKQTMTENTVKAGEYVGFYTGMAAKEIGETVYVAIVYEANGVTYCSGIVSYSIDYYCVEHAENNASRMQELAAATTVYGYYAKNYFAD